VTTAARVAHPSRGVLAHSPATCAAAFGLVALVACDTQRRPPAVDSTRTTRALAATASPSPPTSGDVPAYLQPIFRALDTLLTDAQRDTLRTMTPDSALGFRVALAPLIKQIAEAWALMPIGDTLRARGAWYPDATASILLDLYQQRLRAQPLDFAAAFERLTRDSSPVRPSVRVDTVLLQQDLDGNGGTDRLRREAQTMPFEDTVITTVRQLALYLDSASASSPPTWASSWHEFDAGLARQPLSLPGGGSLLVVIEDAADAVMHTALIVRRGEVRKLLHHQVDHGEGDFSIREDNGRIVLTATKKVELSGHPVELQARCRHEEWPGATLVLDAAGGRFVVERAICAPRQ
jgi:hypothetical protein